MWDIPFYDLPAARLLPSMAELVRFPSGIFTSLRLLKKIHPTAILSFGGYLGGTVAIAAKLLSIPIYLHEQTVIAGRSNKLIGKLAKKVYLTWDHSIKYFDKSKAMVIGLPLRAGIISSKPKSIFSRHKPTLLVMGGKQGAHSVNQFIFKNLSNLLFHFNIVHQTGTSTVTGDYERAISMQNELGSLSDCYLPLGYISEEEIGTYLSSANLYLGRSGAHICYELGIKGLKSILIPLMSTHDHEQYKNAEILVKAQLGLIIPQSELTLLRFLDTSKKLNKLTGNPLDLPKDASVVLIEDLLSELG
jgi:UDP-N-acetylglucosamine--N-acetylmuramyl-(pentapeptide) pyrophosphoryl-undecaprenol N-acetylglucosamine transferase